MPTTPKPKDTLLSYLRVQENFDRKMYSVLNRAASDIVKDIQRAASVDGIGAAIRKEQLLAVKKTIHTKIADIMREAGLLIAAKQNDAAAAGISTFLKYEEVLLTATGLSDEYIQMYLRSAAATADIGIAAARQRLLGTSYVPLSKQVYKTTQLATGQVDRFLESALARGLNAREIAAGVRGFIRPDVPGGVSYASLRLGRTEINNAFHAVQAEKARKTPWIEGVEWNLSGSHPDPDECDQYASDTHFEGGDPGVFLPKDIPRKPHPNCLCFTTPVTVGEDEFLDGFFSGKYDTYVDKTMKDAGYSKKVITESRIAAQNVQPKK